MHHTLRLGAIVTVLLGLLLAPAGAFAESEPNDTIATADTSRLLQIHHCVCMCH